MDPLREPPRVLAPAFTPVDPGSPWIAAAGTSAPLVPAVEPLPALPLDQWAGSGPGANEGMEAVGPLPALPQDQWAASAPPVDAAQGLAPAAPPAAPAAAPAPAPAAPGSLEAAAAALLAPGAGPDYSQLAAAQAPEGSALVLIGDNLPRLAQRHLGDASRWPEIFELNKDQILNPEVILPGMVLRLPRGPKPANPPAPPPVPAPPPKPDRPAEPSEDATALRNVTPQQLAYLGANDKAKFFAVLKPAAVEAERKYGVPWQVTLAQAALESGWAKSAIGGYNIFGIKGSGPAGSVTKPTKEWRGGRYVSENARFAKYNDFYEAVVEHGKLFHNGYYDKAVKGFARDRDPVAFVRNIQGIYATSPTYQDNILSIMRQYKLI